MTYEQQILDKLARDGRTQRAYFGNRARPVVSQLAEAGVVVVEYEREAGARRRAWVRLPDAKPSAEPDPIPAPAPACQLSLSPDLAPVPSKGFEKTCPRCGVEAHSPAQADVLFSTRSRKNTKGDLTVSWQSWCKACLKQSALDTQRTKRQLAKQQGKLAGVGA